MSSISKETKVYASLAELQTRPLALQRELGYADTLREILQQPATWRGTANLAQGAATLRSVIDALRTSGGPVVLTGSGSSMYIGECLAPTLRLALEVPVQAIAAGTLLTHWRGMLPPQAGLLISLARSGDSPESTAVVNRLLADAPEWRHLVITCNARGKLATQYNGDPRVSVLVLDERTNDCSLVMTSSFTNLLLAGAGLAQGNTGAVTQAVVDRLTPQIQRIFEEKAAALAALGCSGFATAMYLGSGGAIGAAHECALKMLEMTGGDVLTQAESFLGLRHGPMSSVRSTTLVFALLSPDPAVRAYEVDLLRELSRKQLGMAKLLIGEGIPADLIGANDVAIDLEGLASLPDEEVPTLLAGIVVGQLLAFFRCLSQGARPDAPSQGVLTRVVEDFAIHVR